MGTSGATAKVQAKEWDKSFEKIIEELHKKDLAPKSGKSPSRFTKSRVGKFGARNNLKSSATSSYL